MENEKIIATAIKKIATILTDELYENISEDTEKELQEIKNEMFYIIEGGRN